MPTIREEIASQLGKMDKPLAELTDVELQQLIATTESELDVIGQDQSGSWLDTFRIKDRLLNIFLKEKDRREHPNRIRICEKHRCYEPECGPGNKELEIALAKECGTQPDCDSVDGKDIELLGKKFHIECTWCLGACLAAPIVEIDIDGKTVVPAKVTSIDSLRKQIQQVIDGTWDYLDWPE